MYPCKVQHNGETYSSADALFQSLKAETCGDKKLAYEIASEDNPHEIKRLSKKIKVTPKWNKKEKLSTMKIVTDAKFKGDNTLGNKLASEVGHLYEAGFDSFWSSKLSLGQRDSFKQDNLPGQNNMGKILEKLRDELKAQLEVEQVGN